jgi:hypothetical protein
MKNDSNNALTLSTNVSATVLKQIEALPCFQGLSTDRLCQIAQSKMRNKRTIQCRVTAMLVIVGATPLNDEVFMIPPTINERDRDLGVA